VAFVAVNFADFVDQITMSIPFGWRSQAIVLHSLFSLPLLSSRTQRRLTRLTRLGLAALIVVGIVLAGSITHSETTPEISTDFRSPDDVAPLTRAALLDRLAAANVIYLGEYHDRAYDHQAQLEIIRELQARNPKLTIAMEMFQRPFQGAIDAYLAGEIEEAELLNRTEYETRWGYPWELYAPILRYARETGIPVIAANAPTELTRKVAASGLTGLSGDDFRDIPPIAEIQLDDADYRRALFNFFQLHMTMRSAGSQASQELAQSPKPEESEGSLDLNPDSNPEPSRAESSDNDGFERFFAAQVLWDETMAEAIANAYHRDPDRQIIVIAGRGHIAYNFGIPSRVQRRVLEDSSDGEIVDMIEPEVIESEVIEPGISELDRSDPQMFIQTSVFFVQQEADREPLWPVPPDVDPNLADYFWSF